jgi:uncharacterized protein YbjT (DUF2867 family)
VPLHLPKAAGSPRTSYHTGVRVASGSVTVMVTGASGLIGRALIPRLLARDEVRATVRRPDAAPPLRALGAKVAVDPLEDPDALAEILPRVVTLVHLVGGPRQVDDDALLEANHTTTLRTLEAARSAGVPRFVLLSVPGASAGAVDPFLRAKGLAEEAVVGSGLEHAILRCSHVYGLGGLWFTAVVQGALEDPPLAIGGEAAVAPVFAEDVAAVIAAIDERAGPLAGTWGLEGAEAIAPADLAGMLAPHAARSAMALADLGPDAGPRLEALLDIAVAPAAVRHLLDPARADAPDAAAAFAVERTSLEEGLRRTLALAAAGAGSGR